MRRWRDRSPRRRPPAPPRSAPARSTFRPVRSRFVRASRTAPGAQRRYRGKGWTAVTDDNHLDGQRIGAVADAADRPAAHERDAFRPDAVTWDRLTRTVEPLAVTRNVGG